MGSHKGQVWVAGIVLILMLGIAPRPAGAQTAPSAKTNGASAAKITKDTTAAAQDLSDDSDKVDESYEPKGIEAGQFLLLPKLEVDGVYNSNIFASGLGAKPDYFARVVPNLKVRSRFTRHELNFEGRVEQIAHVKYATDDRTNLTGAMDGRFDVSKTWEITGFTTAISAAEDRSSPNAVNGVKPTPTDTVIARTGSKAIMGRTTLSGNVEFERLEFSNVSTSAGTVIRNTLRNRDEYRAQARLGYEFSPGYSALIQVTGDKRDYDSNRDANGFNRSSDGYRIETGLGVDISQVLRGDVVVGYLDQNFKDPRFRNVGGIAFKGALNWTPSRLTVVIPSIERSVAETIQGGVIALSETVVGLTVRHELARNIILLGSVNTTFDDYKARARQPSITPRSAA